MNKIQKMEREFMDEIKEVVKKEFMLMAERRGWQKQRGVKNEKMSDVQQENQDGKNTSPENPNLEKRPDKRG